MDVTVKGRGVDVTPAMREYAQKRLNKLTDFDHSLRAAEVTYKLEKNFHKVEVTVYLSGGMFRAEERRQDMYEAVDFVHDKLEQQVKRHHKRAIDKTRHHSTKEVPAAFAAAVAPDVSDYSQPSGSDVPTAPQAMSETGNGTGHAPVRISRVKRFNMKPMSPEDAAIEMDMLGHVFYAFRDAESDEVNVVYHRDDGSYGLIEPGDGE